LSPNQSELQFLIKEQALDFFKTLIINIVFFEQHLWEAVGCPCKECCQEVREDKNYSFKLPGNINKQIESIIKPNKHRINTSIRITPKWSYYRNFKKGVTLVKSEALADLLSFILQNAYIKPVQYQDTKFFFFITKLKGEAKINNVLQVKNIQASSTILASLEKLDIQTKLILLENRYVLIGKNWLLVQDSICGIDHFKLARDEVRKRILYEKELLFSRPTIKWAKKINGDAFESLVKELLEREEEVIWVRKAGLTNEGDSGRDLIASMRPNRLAHIRRDNNTKGSLFIKPTVKVVVQCKALAKSVGKADVTDVRDTIELFNAQGYFLIVSSYLTSGLITYLEALSSKNYFTDWWTRSEIESRLIEHEDLIAKYSTIVSIAGDGDNA
jgi:hypothetical protein